MYVLLKKFINLSSQSNTYKYSFRTRTIKDWNSLPISAVESSDIETFKNTLRG